MVKVGHRQRRQASKAACGMGMRRRNLIGLLVVMTRRCAWAASAAWIPLFLSATPMAAGASNPVQYDYDALGRLVQTELADIGSVQSYSYDAVGNINFSTVSPINSLSVGGLSSSRGAAGTQITIYGSGFSTTAGNNTVTVNGVSATVVSATATRLVVIVPSSAASGVIQVTANGSTVAGDSQFTVTGGNVQPGITGFSPTAGSAGTVVTLAGTFDPAVSRNKVLLNGLALRLLSVSPTSITGQIPAGATAGHFQIATPSGMATSAAAFAVPPAGSSASVGASGTVAENGGSLALPLTGSNQIAIATFDLTQGEQFVRVLANSSFGVTTATVYGPKGNALGSFNTGSFLDLATIAATGTYSIVVADGTQTGTVTVAVAKAVVKNLDVTWNTGANFTSSAGVLGQTHRFTVAGVQGETLALAFTPSNGGAPTSGAPGYPQILLVDANGNVVSQTNIASGTATLVGLGALPATGTYSIVVDPGSSASGSYRFSAGSAAILSVDSPAAYLAMPDGSPASTAGRVYFQGTVGRTVTLHTVHDTRLPGSLPNNFVSFYQNSNSSQIAFLQSAVSPDYSWQIESLPAADTYYFQFTRGSGGNTGFDVRVLSSPSVAVSNNSSASLAIGTVGQMGTFTFSGTAGNYAGLELSPAASQSLLNVAYTIIAPNGTAIWPSNGGWTSQNLSNNGPTTIPLLLSQSGQYTMWIAPVTGTFSGYVTGAPQIVSTFSQDSQQIVPGSVVLTQSTPVTGSLTKGGAAIPVITSVVGQSARLTFNGTLNQSDTFTATNVTFTSSTGNASSCRAALALYNPGATGTRAYLDIAQHGSTNTSSPVIVPSTQGNSLISFTLLNFNGTYTIEIAVSDGCTVNMNATLR
jgi:YD repeat-containing protein